ncbi:uncharacterized protein BKA78DRAFT_2508 [Phyllosticta capitalensis]|uniref:uncharacterized protein n=1 Tax=Phyllosticta capitalensis TaxID=121624 RepID=UPI0031328ABA
MSIKALAFLLQQQHIYTVEKIMRLEIPLVCLSRRKSSTSRHLCLLFHLRRMKWASVVQASEFQSCDVMGSCCTCSMARVHCRSLTRCGSVDERSRGCERKSL